MKKALCIASVASNLDNFNRDNVEILLSMGYDVTLASNFNTNEDINSKDKIDSFVKEMISKGIHIEQIDFTRSMKKIGQQITSIRQVKSLLSNNYDLIHCHTPICAAITRYVAIKFRKRYGTRVVYTAHGFHFYNGAPAKNWLIFYPIEKYLSRFTDTLITINKEDYERAKNKFHAKNTEYLHGIGINTNKFNTNYSDVEVKRQELGLSDDDIMILSVGELSIRKNQELIIRSLAQINNNKLHYCLAGMGSRYESLKSLVKDLHLEQNVHFLGYRTDISELCQSADLYIFPSLQEGLPVALMEAIACKVPILCSSIRGNTDLIKDKSCLFNPKQVSTLTNCINEKIGDLSRKEIRLRFKSSIEENYKTLLQYTVENVHNEMLLIYDHIKD